MGPSAFIKPKMRKQRLRDTDGKPFDPETGYEAGVAYEITVIPANDRKVRHKILNWNGYWINDPFE